ncbi:MAG TPA: hydrolase TatD [Gammaproteobacteria bacterium]|jgi:TatD DNase family protein|nr:hydrolase TatD [Gammaproteobacteria bacterium]
MSPVYTDICFNFTHSAFRKDEAEVLARAVEAGVTQLIVTGSSIEESRQGIALAEKYPQHLWATAGVHPHLASEWNAQSKADVIEMAKHEKAVAIGECGLDFNRDFSPREKQKYAFEAQLELAAELELPAFMHERDAHDEFMRILERYRDDLTAAVIHCFTGEKSQLENYLALDLYVGITGWICDERRGHHLHEIVTLIPDNRLLIETDAPYLLPRDLSPKPKERRNEPAFLPHICRAIAQHRNTEEAELAQLSTANAANFFKLSQH